MVCPPEVPAFVTVQELSAYTGTPERTLHYHIEIGALSARRMGPRRFRIPIEEAERYAGGPITRNSRKNNNLPIEALAHAS
jgi:excisionase family DNA binding protein